MLRSKTDKIRIGRLCAAFILALACAAPQIGLTQDGASGAKTNGAHSNATAQPHHRRSRRAAAKRRMVRGQQKIDPERAQEIQQALIREHYLTGTAVGTWNQASEDAMRRYQADHGWQSKTVPDSRALISLGLGPSHDHLLNPESAMMTDQPPAHGAQAASASMHALSPIHSSAASVPADKTQDPPPSPPVSSDQSSPQ